MCARHPRQGRGIVTIAKSVRIVAFSLMDLFSPIWHQTKNGGTSLIDKSDPADWSEQRLHDSVSLHLCLQNGRMVPKSRNNLIPAAPSSLLGSKTCASFSSAQEKQLSSVWVCNSCRESSGDKPDFIPLSMTERSSSSFRYNAVPKAAGVCTRRFPLLIPLFYWK